MDTTILGIDIGGTKCAVIIGRLKEDDNLVLVDKFSFPTETEKGLNHTIVRLFETIDTILEKGGLTVNDVSAAGISCGGPLDSMNGIIMSPPNLPGWDFVRITDMFEARFGIRTYIQNDANACALAEWKYGAAKGFSNVVFLTFGTGMGAGLILDGKLYTGANDMAGEVGHIRLDQSGPVGYGKMGSFEGFCSGGGIAQLAKSKVLEKLQLGENVSFCKDITQLANVSAKTVAEAAFEGNSLALEIYETCGCYLGKGLSVLIDILNPELIVLGSIYGRAQLLIEPAMRKVIEKETISHSRKICRIVPAGLQENIGDYAALSVATYQLKKKYK